MMRWLYLLLLSSLIASPGCSADEQEKMLQAKETKLNEKEQQLSIREQTIQLKEEELTRRQQLLDSTTVKVPALPDTLSRLHPQLPGVWNVTMRCTETTCAGSAVGDTKTEQWQLSFQNNNIIVQAMSDKKLLRIYTGSYIANFFELSSHQEGVDQQQATKMLVKLQVKKADEMTGQREIIRENDCRIVYALELRKQQ
ncbi:MAG: hypothetical protein Q7T76_05215 [Ferruginibacter sp.]|nr:hypothetical protein [Ferruginibacter sp.]